MEQSHSEANSRSATEELITLHGTRNFVSMFTRDLQLAPMLSQKKQGHTLLYLFGRILILSPLLCLGIPICFSPSLLLIKVLCSLYALEIYEICFLLFL
jgi:hypothetical protein